LAAGAGAASKAVDMTSKHLYVHIPFCRSRCGYCDFASEPLGSHARAGRVEGYLEALRAELGGHVAGMGVARGQSAAVCTSALAGALHPGAVETIYVGGGTPTALPGETLVALARDLLALRRDAPGAAPGAHQPVRLEFTVEANPGTIDATLLERLAAAGVTRLSLGVQSFAPALRAALGRRVAQKEIEAALAAIAATGWGEWNLDLVFGIPGQTWVEAAADLDAAVAAGPTHISLYDLTYTPAFEARVEAALGAHARLAAATFAEQHYAEAVARLEAAGYHRYEVSNFALPGHECRHNQAYWRGEDYLGIGAAAVSTAGGQRRTNPRSVRDYLAGCPPRIEVLSPATRLWEKAMLGLRTSEGVEEAAVLPALDKEARDRLFAQGCLERRCGKLRLNPGFLDVSNAVISALLVSPEESEPIHTPVADGTHRATTDDS
jgi:oxygen-independent coproporphyrinogen-3 oxidase